MSAPSGSAADERLIRSLLLSTGLPADLASQLPASVLQTPLTDLGVHKVGHRHRLLSLLKAKAARAADVAESATGPPLASIQQERAIPRKLFTFWFDGHASELNRE